MTTLKLNQKIWRRLAQQVAAQKRLTAVLAVGVFTALGVAILLWAHAATPVISLEPESGMLASGATAVTDINASGGKAVKFPSGQSTTPQPVGVAGNWTLKFDDEFNGTSLDTSKWVNYCKLMNNASPSLSNVSVANGVATLKLASSSSGAMISSASVDNCGNPASPYSLPIGGYAEARAYFPVVSGTSTCANWPAWWVSGPNWPTSGEHDVAETLSGKLTINYHYGPSSPGYQTQFPQPSGSWCGSWHTYGVYRGPAKTGDPVANGMTPTGHAVIYWDGKQVAEYATYDNGNPEALILNIGSHSSSTDTTQPLIVDYVRAWE